MDELTTSDPAALTERLRGLDRARRSAFAAACAESIFALFEIAVRTTGDGDAPLLRRILDAVWDAVDGGPGSGLDGAEARAAAQVPDEDAVAWTPGHALAQNVAASVAYAARTWTADDAGSACWAAHQVLELVDFIETNELASNGESSGPGPGMRDGGRLVAVALGHVEALLDQVESPGFAASVARAQAEAFGAGLLSALA